VGILRPDGDTQVGADVLALTVRTYYMPNEDWQVICQRDRALRGAEGTLTGHASGNDLAPVLDHLVALRAIGSSPKAAAPRRSAGVPEPLANIVDQLEELDEAPEFISTADLAEELDFDAAWLGRRLAELGCQSTRERVTSESGRVRQICGYLIAAMLAAADSARDGEL
jgi:S-DNA-T family DNA segregation ATPase FtsK/SpoIIIE